jgi:hypothetical protein
MNFSTEELAMLSLIIGEEDHPRKERKWVHQAWMKMGVERGFETLYKELVDNEIKFSEYFRMSQYTFNIFLNKTENYLKKQYTYRRLVITSRERLSGF